MKKLIPFIFLGSIIVGAELKNFHHILESVPKSEGSCHVVTRDIADRVSKASGIAIQDAACVAEDSQGYQIELGYLAEKPIEFPSTRYRELALHADRYIDLKTCQDRLPGQTALFESATGLESFIAYCRPERYSSPTRWSPTIEAVGTPLLEPRAGGFMLFTSPKSIPLEEFFDGLNASMKRLDGVLGETIVHPQLASHYVTFHYFSKSRLSFWMVEPTKVPVEKTCIAQAAEAKRFLSKTARGPYVVYCAKGSFGLWELEMGFVETPSFGWRRSLENFATLEACEANSAAVVSTYSQNETGILGGLCSQRSSDWRYSVVLFKEGMTFDPIGEP